jgi:hypothetical protein
MAVILITIWWLQKLGKIGSSKQEAQKFYVERFNFRKVRKQLQIKVSNRFAALEILNHSQDINRAWEIITENIKTSAKESLDL